VICHVRQDADRSAFSLEETLGYAFQPSIRRVDLPISMLPFKKAPSPMLIPCVVTFPIKELSPQMSTRSLASMLPHTSPRTTTSRAVIFAVTSA
jgi:hypothetical protein